jgi:hypothetical protein
LKRKSIMKSSKTFIAMAVIALASAVVQAADEQQVPAAQKHQAQAAQITGFGSGSGMGPGGGFGNAGSVVDGRSSVVNNNSGSQSFGGGFDRQQARSAGPLSTNRSAPSNGTPNSDSYGPPVANSPSYRSAR